MFIGVGASSCGTWTADRVNPYSFPAIADGSWVLGFLSGIAYEGPENDDPLAGTDAQGVFAWIDNYCRANPIDHISAAAEAFYGAHPHP